MKRLPSRPDHRPWSDFDDATLVAMYPSTPNNTLVGLMGRTAPAISGRATKLGLKKSAEFMAASPTRFQAGSVPKNKGLKGWQAGGRSAETRFKPGRAAHEYARYVPIGTLRIGADGRLIHIRASKVGENGIKPDVWYTLDAQGEFVESATKGVSE